MNIVVDKLPNDRFDCPFSRFEEKNRVFCRLDDEVCTPFNCPYLITLKEAQAKPQTTYGITPKRFKERAQKIFKDYEGDACIEGHIKIDDLMYECLGSLGYEEGLKILFSMDNIWYG